MNRLLTIVRAGPVTSTQKLLRVLVVVIVVSSIALAAWIGVLRARQTENTVRAIIAQQAEIAGSQFRLFFVPVMAQLVVIRELGQEGILDPSEPEEFKKALAALVSPLEQVGTLRIVGEDEHLSLTYRGAEWSPAIREEALDSPWYRGAIQAEKSGSMYWTDTTGGEPGLVASIAWREHGDDSPPIVLSMGIKQSQLGEFIRALPNNGAGDLLLLSYQDRVVRFSSTIDDFVEITTREEFFRAAEGAAGSTVTDFLRQLEPGGGVPEPLRFILYGSPWWLAVQSIPLGERTIWIGLDSPEGALLAGLQQREHILIYVLAGVLVLGVTVVIFLAGSFGRKLQELAEKPHYSTASEQELLTLINHGEQERLEFKSTLRWNLKSGKPGNEIARAWLKTLVAFMNTDGGTLLIGVRDNGEVLGLSADQFPNEDKYLLHFNNLIKQHIGLEHAGQITPAIRSVQDERILVIDCESSTNPVFLSFGDEEEFFVRVGSGTRKLPVSKVLEYINSRLAGQGLVP